MRTRFHINGIVQGVGFRPYVFRLATEERLFGFVNNGSDGVTIEVEGKSENLNRFALRLQAEAPPLARIQEVSSRNMPVCGDTRFNITQTTAHDSPQTLISPDVSVCEDCLRELRDPSNPRFEYPFINCTNCGPRFTIVRQIPYDRPKTSMADFPMCAYCEREYRDPLNRRFHAQPVACPQCGPHLWIERRGQVIANHSKALMVALDALNDGCVIAIRGLGGFHLAADARNPKAVAKLRNRKGREHKPFAIMVRDLAIANKLCHVDPVGRSALTDGRRPIVLMPRRTDSDICAQVAPKQGNLGLMLPYTPLHALLLDKSFDALVMTSGNHSNEPIAAELDEARARLQPLADLLLMHNREIVTRCDDSVFLTTRLGAVPIRRARGYVPEPIRVKTLFEKPLFACGGQFKTTTALCRDHWVFMSQHLGDQDQASSFDFFLDASRHLQSVLRITPQAIACDMHPDYLTSKWARAQSLPLFEVQHHHAHLAALHAEHGLESPILGVVLDGTGYGSDGTIWGGELLFGDAHSCERLAWLDPVAMPGGTAAIREPWRMGIAYLRHLMGSAWVHHPHPLVEQRTAPERDILERAIAQRLHAPLTSSCGRLFDAVAALIGIRQQVTYEGQAAIELETISRIANAQPLETIHLHKLGPLPLAGVIESILQRYRNQQSPAEIGRWFHQWLSELWLQACSLARDQTGCQQVGLTGGVFQNRLLTETLAQNLEDAGFQVYIHRQVPPNDGGIALGQAMVAQAQMQQGGHRCV